MSYILKALRKSEQERQAKQPESVTDRILTPQQPEKPRRTALWVSAIILVNLFILGGFYWYFKLKPAPSASHEPAKTQVATPRNPTPEKTPAIMNDPPKPFAERKQASRASIVEQIAARRRRENKDQSQGIEAPSPSSPTASTPSAKDSVTPADQIETSPVQVQQPIEAEIEPYPEDDDEVMEGPAPSQTKAQDKQIPYLDELPYPVRQTIPKMTINAFVYTVDPSERFVIINMEKYKKGQKTKDAVELKEIRRDSVVLSFQDQTFQIGRP